MCLVTQSCLTLRNSMDCSPPSSSVHGIFQAGILEWVAILFSRGSSQPRDGIPCLSHLLHWPVPPAKPNHMLAKWSEVTQSSPTRCDPMGCSLPGSSVYGIFQARVLEWVAISFSRGSSWPRDRTQVSCIVDRHFAIWATRKSYVNQWIKIPIYALVNILPFFSFKWTCV